MRGPRTPNDRRKREVALFLRSMLCSWDGSPGCCWCCERLWIFLLNSRSYTRCTSHQFKADRRQTPNAKSSRKKIQSPAHDPGVKLMEKFTRSLLPYRAQLTVKTGVYINHNEAVFLFSHGSPHIPTLFRVCPPLLSCILPR